MRSTASAVVVLFTALLGILPASDLCAQRSSVADLGSRNQVVLEIGPLSGGLSYARRVARTRLSIGAGLWGAFEPPHTFDRNVFEPIGGLVFTRLRLSPWLHGDLGPAILNYYWADDCDECTGTFVGLRLAGRIGSRLLFLGPDAWVGSVRDAQNGSDFGAMIHLQIRLVIGWGR